MEKRRRLVRVIVAGIVLMGGAGAWWNYLNVDAPIVVPTRKAPKPNAYDYYVKAGKMLAELTRATPNANAIDPATDTDFDYPLIPESTRRKYPAGPKLRWIRKCAPVLRTLRQGFAYEHLEPRHKLSDRFPHLVQHRKLARLLVVESHVRSEQGDWPGALHSTLDALKLGIEVPRGGLIISGQVGLAIGAIGRKELRAILPHLDSWSARGAARRIEQLERRRVPYTKALEEEKWQLQGALHEMTRRPHWRVNTLRHWLKTPAYRQSIPDLFVYSDRDILEAWTRWMDTVIEQSSRPYRVPLAPPRSLSPFDTLCQQDLLPVYQKFRFQSVNSETASYLMMLQLALHAYRLEHGRYPEALSELTPTYLKTVPRDPFGAGEAMRYRKTAKAYLLYSIGPDGKDDGGKAAPAPSSSRPNARYLVQGSTGDFVAGINR